MNMPPQKSASGLVQAIRTVSLTLKLLRSSKVPTWTKIIPFLGVIYLIFPLDFVPDFIPGLGQLDDLTVLLLCLWAFLQLVPANVIREMSDIPTPTPPKNRTADANVVDATFRVVKDDETASASAGNNPPTGRS